MITIKNITGGPKGVNTIGGIVYLESGEQLDLEIVDAEHRAAYSTGWFEMPEPTVSDADGGSDREDLKAQADELGITYARNIPTAKLKEAIDAKLAEPAAPAPAPAPVPEQAEPVGEQVPTADPAPAAE
jgi:hypothetical protein